MVWSLSTRRVLTLENVAAIKIGDYEAITAAGIDRAAVASAVLDAYMQMILEDGFFHADPHPGNLFVTPLEGIDEDGNANWQLTFIDFGMVGRVPENLQSRAARSTDRRRDPGRGSARGRATRRSACCCPAPT